MGRTSVYKAINDMTARTCFISLPDLPIDCLCPATAVSVDQLLPRAVALPLDTVASLPPRRHAAAHIAQESDTELTRKQCRHPQRMPICTVAYFYHSRDNVGHRGTLATCPLAEDSVSAQKWRGSGPLSEALSTLARAMRREKEVGS